MKPTACLLVLFALTSTIFAADVPADALAKAVLDKAGIRATVCEMPRVGDGTLAAALARAGVAQVHALAPDAQAADAARKPAAAGGVLGSQVIIETGKPDMLPLGDWVADLYVVADATDANLKSLSAAEAGRVLSPYRGVAVVGNPAGAKSGLTKAALKEWAKGTGGMATITEDASGLWAVVKMPPLKGGDDWSHYLHGADGNLVSKDTVFGSWPFGMQWMGQPWQGGQWDVHVVSAGRLFSAMGTPFFRPGRQPCQLLVRSTGNGELLWSRPLAKDFGDGASLLVATPERLFLKDGDGVLVLNAETGAEIRRLTVTEDKTGNCLWMLLSEGVLLTLCGPAQKYDKGAYSLDRADKLAVQGDINRTFAGTELRAWEETTGKMLWQYAAERIDPSKLAAGGGRVFLYQGLRHAVCLDAKTGAQLWKTEAPIAEPAGPGMGYIDGHVPAKDFILRRSGAILAGNTYLINYTPGRHSQAFSADDGHILWTRLQGPQGDDPKKGTEASELALFEKPLVMGGNLIERRTWRRPTDTFELLTGNPVLPGTHFRYLGCGRFIGVANQLLIGMVGEIYDLTRQQWLTRGNVIKASCGTGYLIADGLLFKTQGSCAGCCEWRGTFAARSVPASASASSPRLTPGQPAPPDTPAADPKDWLTYRSNSTRCGSSAATVPAGAVIRWVYAPTRPTRSSNGVLAPDVTISPPIAVGDRIWFGTPEGAVVCLDRRSGSELWRYWTAGRVYAAPTWRQGRLYVGSWDGQVHCLDAATGALVWRYRVAPEERRIMFWGRLASAWPIYANVLVENGTAYAAAGIIPGFGGTVLCALDADTGALRWEKRFDEKPPLLDPSRHRLTRAGEGRDFSISDRVEVTGVAGAYEELCHHLRLMSGPTTYTIEGLKPDSVCVVRLHLFEPWNTQAGKRLFDVAVNGLSVLKGFDVFASAGGKNKAVVRDLPAQVDSQGRLAIQFSGTPGCADPNPVLNGIEVRQGDTLLVGIQTGGPAVPGIGFRADPGFPAMEEPPAAPAATGQLAWQDGRLWWHAGDWGAAVVNPATGEMKPAMRVGGGDSWDGQDIGLLPGGWVTYGGRQFNLPQEAINQPGRIPVFQALDDQGQPTTTILNLVQAHCGGASSYRWDESIPVWDGNEVLLRGKQSSLFQPVLCRNFGSQLRAWAQQNTPKSQRTLAVESSWVPSPDSSRPVLPESWGKRSDFLSPVLTSNAVVFVGGHEIYSYGWHAYAVSRADQTMLWDLYLPSAPMQGSLSLTCAGDVLVPLVDGRLVCLGNEGDGVSPRSPSKVSVITEPGLQVRYCDAESGATIKTETDGTLPITAAKLDQPYVLQVEGMIKVPAPGKYVLSLHSNKTASTLYLNGTEELRATQNFPNRTSGIWLAEGNYAISIVCPGVKEGTKLLLQWQRPGRDKPEDIEATCLSHTNETTGRN